jgi:hypothetical protein
VLGKQARMGGIEGSLETPEKIRSLRTKLYAKAKAERRHKVSTRGTRVFGWARVCGALGVLSLHASRRGRTAVSLA